MLSLFISCSEDSKVETDIEDVKNFAVGSKYAQNKDNVFTRLATIWIDGIPTILSETGSSIANAIALYDNDIYVVGTESLEDGKRIIKVWKNNQSEIIAESSTLVEATDIVVDEGDVHVVGNKHNNLINGSVATLWKNGRSIPLCDAKSEANAVYVYNDDIYVAGWQEINGICTAIVWKNGSETVLYSGKDDLLSGATDIYVDATGIYVTGYIRNSSESTAMFWKNGVATPLSNPEDYTEAKALFVHNSDVYICGFELDIHDYLPTGKIWKNGNLIDEIANAKPESIYIKEDEIFAGGIGLEDAKIWKSNLNNLDFVEQYKFASDEIKAIMVK